MEGRRLFCFAIQSSSRRRKKVAGRPLREGDRGTARTLRLDQVIKGRDGSPWSRQKAEDRAVRHATQQKRNTGTVSAACASTLSILSLGIYRRCCRCSDGHEALPSQLDWRSSDWHRDRIAQSPERAAYVAKLKAWGEKQWQLFELGMHNKLPASPVAVPGTTAQTNTPPPAEGRTPTERLQVLKQLFDQKLITQEEYDRKKAEIIKSM